MTSTLRSGPGTNGFLPSGIEIAEEAIWDPTTNRFYIEVAANADAIPATNVIIENPGLFNGSTFDRMRSTSDITVLASAGRTTTQTVTSPTIPINPNLRGVTLTVSITVIGTGTIIPAIQYQDVASTGWITILGATSGGTGNLSSNGTYVYQVYPGLATNAIANNQPTPATYGFALPRTWRVVITAVNANSVTYSVGAALLY